MNENLFRTQFDQLETTEKQALMERLAARYDMTFHGLHTFDRWGQNCTTGIFEKDGREFVFVPGDTVTLGWEQFAVGLNQESRDELEYLFREWEMEQDPEEMIRESMAPVRQAAKERSQPRVTGCRRGQRQTPCRPFQTRRWCSSGPSGQRYVDREKPYHNEQPDFPSAPVSRCFPVDRIGCGINFRSQ